MLQRESIILTITTIIIIPTDFHSCVIIRIIAMTVVMVTTTSPLPCPLAQYIVSLANFYCGDLRYCQEEVYTWGPPAST